MTTVTVFTCCEIVTRISHLPAAQSTTHLTQFIAIPIPDWHFLHFSHFCLFITQPSAYSYSNFIEESYTNICTNHFSSSKCLDTSFSPMNCQRHHLQTWWDATPESTCAWNKAPKRVAAGQTKSLILESVPSWLLYHRGSRCRGWAHASWARRFCWISLASGPVGPSGAACGLSWSRLETGPFSSVTCFACSPMLRLGAWLTSGSRVFTST